MTIILTPKNVDKGMPTISKKWMEMRQWKDDKQIHIAYFTVTKEEFDQIVIENDKMMFGPLTQDRDGTWRLFKIRLEFINNEEEVSYKKKNVEQHIESLVVYR